MSYIMYYCTCGAAWEGPVNPHYEPIMRDVWKAEHTGPGHSLCDRRTALRNRKAAEERDFHDLAETSLIHDSRHELADAHNFSQAFTKTSEPKTDIEIERPIQAEP